MTIDVTPAPAAPRRSWLRRIVSGPATLIRFLIRRFIWVIIRFVRAMWRYPIVALLAVLLVYLGFRGYNTYIADPPPPVAAPQFEMIVSAPPADSVLQYLRGQQQHDAQAIWDSFSTDTQTQQLAQGSTLEALRRSVQQESSQGFRYDDSKYVGGYQFDDGTASYFYLTTVRVQNTNAEIYQIFIVDAQGKITRVDQERVV